MSGAVKAFQSTGSVAVSASTTSASATMLGGGDEVLVTNARPDYIFVRFGGAGNTVTAISSPPDAVVPSGQRRIFTVPSTAQTVAVLLNSGTGTVFVERGSGTQY
jgi:hypothetical protein